MITQQHKDKFPVLVTEMVQICKHLFNAPEEMSLPIILATINFPAQGLTNVNPIQWKSSPLSLYLCVLSDTGSQKSTVMNAVTEALEMYQTERYKQYKKELVDYMIDKKRFDAECKAIANPSKRDQEDEVEYATPEEPESPLSGMMLVQKATLNGIIDTLAESPLAALFNPDAAEFFNSHAFQSKESGTEIIASLAKLYSGEPLQRQTGVSENNVRLDRRRFSMMVMLQQQLAQFLLNATYNDQGFIPRMLVSQPSPSAPPKFDFSAESIARKQALNEAMEPFHERVLNMMNEVFKRQKAAIAKQIMIDPDRPVSNKELILPRLEFETACYPTLEAFGNRMQQLLQQPGNEKHVGYLRRAYDNVCRVAATFAVFDDLKTIPLHYVEGAILTVDWFTQQRFALEIDREIESTKTLTIADDVYEWIKKTIENTGERVTRTDVMQKGPRAFRLKTEAAERTRILNEIHDRGLIVVTEEVATNGKKQLWISLP